MNSNSSKCFVPNCKNTVGIPFPVDADNKRKWLEILGIEDIVPNRSSFVCLDHFEEEDIPEGADPATKQSLRLKKSVVPFEHSPEEQIVSDNNQEDIDNFVYVSLENESLRNNGNASVTDSNSSPNPNYLHHLEENSAGFIENTKLNGNNVEETDLQKEDTLSSVLEEPPDVLMPNSKTCRLCMQQDTNTKNIFEESIDENVPIVVAILACIHPIQVTINDALPKQICTTCLEALENFFRFRSVWLDNDKTQRQDLNKQNNEMKDSSINNKTQKRKLDPTSSTTHKNKCLKQIADDDNYDEYDYDDHSLSDFTITKKESANYKSKKNLPESPPPLVPIQKKRHLVNAKSTVVKEFDMVEEELRRVLEGTLTEEQASAENIIIHVQDDETDESDKVATLSRLKLPIVIKPVNPKKKNDSAPLVSVRKIHGELKPIEEAFLPKGFGSKKAKEIVESEIGVYEGTVLKYVFNSEFCMVDEYLFEYRLCKGNKRCLRCVLPNCLCLAEQNKLDNGQFSNEITVKKPHNHKKPSESDRKKQMFFHVMRRKMQSDKTLNFRSVYDDVCKQDPEIIELIPLRNVVNEICRHQLAYKMPFIASFEEFYESIELDQFHKLQFTYYGKQFYREKFTADDGSKAVIFGNAETIAELSTSKLMYVDSSFKIETKEDFGYQLVTILVWTEESYYPILYALVNRKSQEIYRKIFEYLHDELAPELRPEEIVTDYEANMYYALGETYVESSIGGSVFYYTQNLYKKICALNLSKDLENNSYFRNIYHMLLMLPLLPVNTILDGLNNMEIQSRDLGLTELTRAIFDHVRTEWIMKVTPELFCVHRLENRINENVIAPFKKLRDYIMLSKGKMQKLTVNICTVVEKLIDLEHFLQVTYSFPGKRSFSRDLSSTQKKNVLKAWQFIENHPKINLNNFFSKVLGYVKCMENQLWIWGFYRYDGDVTDDLIDATNFSLVSNNETLSHNEHEDEGDEDCIEAEDEIVADGAEMLSDEEGREQVVMEAVIDENGGFVLQQDENDEQSTHFEKAFLNYVYKE